jgi:SAM-dependent MidA family methyltransferase
MSFRDYMDTCMFDPQVGYYASGHVSFGISGDYWTFPGRMSSVFGDLIAERVLEAWCALATQVEEAGADFHLVEVGGGYGELLRDVVAAIRRRGGADAEACLARLVAVAVDRSPKLVAEQRATLEGAGVRHVEADASQLATVLPSPFYGVVFANELLTQFSVELIRVDAGGASRLRVLPWCGDEALLPFTAERPAGEVPGVPEGLRPLAPDALPRLIRALRDDEDLLRRFAGAEQVRWTGVLEPLDLEQPGPLTDYLRWAAPVLAGLSDSGALPAWVAFAPDVSPVLASVGTLLSSGAGAFLTLDYGGTTRHVFDAHAIAPHLRTFSCLLDGNRDDPSRRDYVEPGHDPLRAPGCEDQTYDLDFSYATALLERAGLRLAFYGHQAALEGAHDLSEGWYRDELEAGRRLEGYREGYTERPTEDLIANFRYSPSYRLFVAATPGLEGAFTSLGDPDPVHLDDLRLNVAALERPDLHRRLVGELARSEALVELLERLASDCLEALHPTGSPVDDLDYADLYAWRHAVLRALEGAGGPGATDS